MGAVVSTQEYMGDMKELNMDGKIGIKIGYIISNGPFWVTFGCHYFLTSSINIPYILVVDPKTKDTLIQTWVDMPTYGRDTAFFWVTILRRIFMVTLFLTNQISRMYDLINNSTS